MITTIRNIDDDTISNHIPKTSSNFVSQLKLYATKQIAEQCLIKMKVCDQEDVVLTVIELYPSNYSPISPPSYSPMSPPISQPSCALMSRRINIQAVDQNDGSTYFDPQPYSVKQRRSSPPSCKRGIDQIIEDIFK
jgi:hypothetical protein